MTTLGTPLTPQATRVLLLGSGELGKEVAIELQRLGVEVIAADRYADAPAMQVAHRSHVLDMLDGAAIRALVERERPGLIVPEIVDNALRAPDTQLRLFGKPRVAGHRRVGVTLARGASNDEARRIAREAAAALTIELVTPGNQ